MLRKLGLKAFVFLVGRHIRDAREGKHGPKWQAALVKAEGLKTETGLAAGAIAAVLAHLGQPEAAAVFGSICGLLVGWGVLDARWRQAPPAWVFTSRGYRFLADHSVDVATLLALFGGWIDTCEPSFAGHLARVHLTCDQAAVVLWAVSGLLTWLGLRDAALKAPPPRIAPSLRPVA